MGGVGHFFHHAPYQLARSSSQSLTVKMSPLWMECHVRETLTAAYLPTTRETKECGWRAHTRSCYESTKAFGLCSVC